MKALVGMLVVLGLSSAAYAATPKSTTSTQAKKKNSKKKAKKNGNSSLSGTTGGATQSAAPITPAAPSAPEAVPAAQTSAASLQTTTQAAAPKRWSFLYDSWNETGSRSTNLGTGEWDATETIRGAYKLTPTLSISLTGQFGHSWGTTSDNRKVFTTYDPYLMLAKTKLLGAMPAGLESKGYVRLYPGISEDSRNKGQTAMLRGSFNIGRELNKTFSIAYEIQPRYYFQTYKTYDTKTNVSDDGTIIDRSVERANDQARLLHFVNIGVNFSSKLSLYQNIGYYYKWYHSDENAAAGSPLRDVPHQENFYGETGLGYSLTDNLSLVAGIYTDSRNQLTQKDDFRFYNDDKSAYFLEGTVTF